MGEFDDEKRKKRQKLLIYIALFVVFQTAIIVIFTLTVMKFRTPKFRVRSGVAENHVYSNNSFSISLNARLGVKNANFGPYKYDATTVGFYYRGTPVGNATVDRSKANFRSTKKFNVAANLVSPTDNNLQLTNDFNAGLLPLTSKSTMSGKITIMFLFKKRRTANMDCSMDINTNTNEIQNLVCK